MKWLFKLFTWRLEVKLSRLDSNERILHLAKRLMDEVEAAGHRTLSKAAGAPHLRTLSIHHHTNISNYPNFQVYSGGGPDDWKVACER